MTLPNSVARKAAAARPAELTLTALRFQPRAPEHMIVGGSDPRRQAKRRYLDRCPSRGPSTERARGLPGGFSTASNRDPPMNEGLPRTPERPFDCLPYRGKLRYSGRKVFQPRGDGDPLLGGTTRELSSVARGRSTDCDARAAAVPAKLSWDVPIYCSSDNAAGDTNPDNHID